MQLMKDIFTNPIFWYTVGGIVLAALAFWISSYFVASYIVYTLTLRRNKKSRWSRDLPKDMDPDQKPMYEAGLAWAAENQAHRNDVHIVNTDGLNLYGEYYDFGNDKCAVILSGRTESLRYGYYFAIPYAKNGYNILVLDPRAHGLSDGEFNTAGFEESKDAVQWLKYIKSEFGVRSFVLHGICIGAATGMFALNNPECPDCVDGIVTEGMFARFYESVKNHIIEMKKPTFITVDLVDAWMKHYTGHSMKRGPLNIISDIHVPLLMLHSREDLYSTPEFAQKLYDASGAENKTLVWFEHGRHSMLRVTDTELYDSSIDEFLSKLNATKTEKVEEVI